MKTLFLERKEKYDGTQLVSLKNYLQHGLLGDSVVAWIGACEITPEHMVDGEDLRAKAEIRGGKMLHFIVEKFETSLFTAVALQRLFAATALELIRDLSESKARQMRREGDDLYLDQKKLSISIATQSPVSSLIHFAVNVNNQDTPVETLSLEDLEVDPELFARRMMTAFAEEVKSMLEASRKVKWVR